MCPAHAVWLRTVPAQGPEHCFAMRRGRSSGGRPPRRPLQRPATRCTRAGRGATVLAVQYPRGCALRTHRCAARSSAEPPRDQPLSEEPLPRGWLQLDPSPDRFSRATHTPHPHTHTHTMGCDPVNPCGPKCAVCCSIISVWGIIFLVSQCCKLKRRSAHAVLGAPPLSLPSPLHTSATGRTRSFYRTSRPLQWT